MSRGFKEESKWKVGDLVTLSSAGLRIDQNRGLTKRNEDGRLVPYGFGMVTKILKGRFERWPVRCQWIAGPQEFASFADYELKRYKA
jgi:hypothetical protein